MHLPDGLKCKFCGSTHACRPLSQKRHNVEACKAQPPGKLPQTHHDKVREVESEGGRIFSGKYGIQTRGQLRIAGALILDLCEMFSIKTLAQTFATGCEEA